MMHAAKLGLGRSTRLGVVLALAALAMLVPVSMAQTPVSEEEAAEGPHPAHIHTGTCDALGEVVHPLTDVAAPSGETQGAATAHPVKIGHTVLDVPLQEIIDGGHAINVHQSAEEIDTYIACGDVGGVVFEEGGRQQLVIGLGELNDSGHHGVAWLGSDGDQTEVSVELDIDVALDYRMSRPPQHGSQRRQGQIGRSRHPFRRKKQHDLARLLFPLQRR